MTITKKLNGPQRIRQWLESCGLSQRQLAIRCGIERSRLNKLLKGKGMPSLEEAIKLQQMTGTPVDSWINQ